MSGGAKGDPEDPVASPIALPAGASDDVNTEDGMRPDACCSFCRKPRSESGPLIEGPETGGVNVYLCRECAELAIHILDEEERRRGLKRGEKPTGLKKSTADMIEICARALDHLESLSKQRGLTEVEHEAKRKVEAELERMRSEGWE
jgi:hypothetical protein